MNANRNESPPDGGIADKRANATAEGNSGSDSPREQDVYAMCLARLISDGRYLENDYGELSRSWGCTSVSGHPRFAVWENGVFQCDAKGNSNAASAVLEDLRAWLPTVGLEEVRFGLSGTQSNWCMILEMNEDPYKVLLEEVYRVERGINEWLDGRHAAAGAVPAGVNSHAAAEHELVPGDGDDLTEGDRAHRRGEDMK